MGPQIELRSLQLLFECCKGLEIDKALVLEKAFKVLQLALKITDLNVLSETALNIAMICNDNP